MDLMTRCPHCAHAFRVSLTQLQLRKGFVRCERCAHIFDGYDAVVPEQDTGAPAAPEVKPAGLPVRDTSADTPIATPPETPRSAPQSNDGALRDPSPPSVIPAVRTSIPYPFSPPAAQPSPVDVAAPFAPTESPPEPVLPSVVRHRMPNPSVAPDARRNDFTISSSTIGSPSRPEPLLSLRPEDFAHRQGRDHFLLGGDEQDDEDFVLDGTEQGDEDFNEDRLSESPNPAIYVEPRADIGRSTRPPAFLNERASLGRRVMRMVWGVLALIALLFAAVFLVYIYRVQIANAAPVLRPLLETACVSLKCQLPYARRIDQIQITKSSLRAGAADAAQVPNAMILEINLRNSYERPQEWPTLVLDLTDFSGATVVRRELPPATYLSADILQQPFAASSEVLVRVPIIPNDVKINGYQLNKYFP